MLGGVGGFNSRGRGVGCVLFASQQGPRVLNFRFGESQRLGALNPKPQALKPVEPPASPKSGPTNKPQALKPPQTCQGLGFTLQGLGFRL